MTLKVREGWVEDDDGSGGGYESGYGYGSGYGFGFSEGFGDGRGFGYSGGFGDGSGDGKGYRNNYGCGIINRQNTDTATTVATTAAWEVVE